MAKLDDEKVVDAGTAKADPIPGVQTPDMDPKTLKINRRAIRDGAQANELGKGLQNGNKDRNNTNAIIVAQYDGEQPFDSAALEAAGEDWRNNFPTRFMGGIIDRVTPAPVALVDSARYLTTAKLDPAKYENADEKSEKFQQSFTRLVRRWEEWRSLIYALCQEEILIGYAITGWTDEYDWRPKFYRNDAGFVPEGTGQHAKSVQSLNFNQEFLIHELVEIIADKDVAEAAKWDIENCVNSINKALPRKTMNTTSDGESVNERGYEDAIREGNRGSSYQNGAKVINVRHVMAVEPNTKKEDGKYAQKVTHYIVDRDSGETLLAHNDRFETITDVIVLFTLHPGNGKFYGSIGLGKILVNLHIAIERARNIAFDQFYMAGLLLLHDKEGKGTPSVQLRVRHPFALISSLSEISQEKIEANVEAFMQLDQKLTSIAEQSANAYIPNKLSDEGTGDRTATEAQIDNARDQQAKVAYLARFWGQFGQMVNAMQRRACNPETNDPEAIEFQEELKTAGLTEEEIKVLANTPSAEVQDLTQMNDQKIIAAAQVLRGRPTIDQQKLERREVSALTSPQIADELILPDGVDPTVEAENVRQQLIENEMFMLGTSINVSPRDHHETHLKTGLGALQDAAPKIAQIAMNAPEIMDHASAALVHFTAHCHMWEQQGANPDQIKEYMGSIQKADQLLQQLAQHVAQAKVAQFHGQVAQAAGGATTASGSPPGVVPGEQPLPPPDPQAEEVAKLHDEAMEHIVGTMDFKFLPPDIQQHILRITGLPESNSIGQNTPGAPNGALGASPAAPTAVPRPPGLPIAPMPMPTTVYTHSSVPPPNMPSPPPAGQIDANGPRQLVPPSPIPDSPLPPDPMSGPQR